EVCGSLSADLRCPGKRSSRDSCIALRVVEVTDSSDPSSEIGAVDEDPGITEGFTEPGSRMGDDRDPRTHRLDPGPTPRFGFRRHEQDAGAGVDVADHVLGGGDGLDVRSDDSHLSAVAATHTQEPIIRHGTDE